jgi:hypothetical protein
MTDPQRSSPNYPAIQSRPDLPLTKYGVVHGGAIITMTETLSRSDEDVDWVLSRLLQSTYIDPFTRINRSDGIIIPTANHMERLRHVHERYTHVCSLDNHSALEMLWVPGLEPSYRWDSMVERLDSLEIQIGMRKEVFDGADMYGRLGGRQGEAVAQFKDRNGWERTLWRLPEILPDGVTEERATKLEEAKVEEEEGEVEGATAESEEGADAVNYGGDLEVVIKQEES